MSSMSMAPAKEISARAPTICSSLNKLSQAHCIPGAELRIGQVRAMQDGAHAAHQSPGPHSQGDSLQRGALS
jgi:hypothetical protein